MIDELIIAEPSSRPYVVTVTTVIDGAAAGLDEVLGTVVARLEAAGVPLAYFELVAHVGVIMTADGRQAAMTSGTAAVEAAAGPMQIRGSEVRPVPASAAAWLTAGHPA